MNRFGRAAKDVRLERVETDFGVAILVFDLGVRRLVREISDYLGLAKFSSLDEKTIEKLAYHLIGFREYLRLNGLTYADVSNKILLEYRGCELERVKADKSHRGQDVVARRTVNSKFDSVLPWLGWLRDSRGMSFVALSLPPNQDGLSRNYSPSRLRGISPVYFKGAAEKSKHRTGLLPRKKTLDKAEQLAFETPVDEYLAYRNQLYIRVARRVGLRNESINSLLAQQFARELIDVDDEYFYVRPKEQKFNYDVEYEFPTQLALEIAAFIETKRKVLIETKNNGADLSQGHVFLSRNAKPMKARSFSEINSALMREVGARKGNAVHVFRKEFGTMKAKQESRSRARHGLDTSTNSIATAVSHKLGQSSPKSVGPYVILQQSSIAREEDAADAKAMEDLKQSLRDAEEANAELTAEIVALKRLLAATSRNKL